MPNELWNEVHDIVWETGIKTIPMEKKYKKGLNEIDNHYDVITDLESDILECEVKWALGSITANKSSGGDGIPNSKIPF